MKILHVTCSPRGRASESYRLSRKIVGMLLGNAPTAAVVSRDVGDGGRRQVDADYALSQQSSKDVSQAGSAVRSEVLIEELENSDVVVVATPMHNYTVPSSLKAWIDHVVRVRRTFDVSPAGKVALLRDRPVLVAVSSGGLYSGDGARQPDFLTPYLETILGMIGLRDLSFFSIQGTAFGPEFLAASRARADQALEEYFASPAIGAREAGETFAGAWPAVR
jgi:FMN-dependent NADH-azoreductase